MNSPLQIGVTGGIGSGKSIVCKIFNALNVPIYDADSRAKWVMEHNTNVKTALLTEFGNQVFFEDGRLNRIFIASSVFNQSEKLGRLNQIVHPQVALDYSLWVQENKHSPYVIKEAALLFESGSYQMLDKIIMVSCPEELRVERIRKRDPHRSSEEILAIISKQLPEQEKINRADYCLLNDESQSLIQQVLHLHHTFLGG